MNVPINVKIRTVERMARIDRYGEPSYNTIFTNIGGCLERSQFMTRGPDGEFKQSDGTLLLDAPYELKAGDLITLDTPQTEKYTVFRAQESLDWTGQPSLRTFTLTKVQDES